MELQEILSQSPDRAARQLLGASLTSTIGGVLTGGIITEVEAYLSSDDAAAHSSRGQTRANASLYKTPGTLYLHSMRQWLLMDIVTEKRGVPSSILIRGLFPTIGKEVMSKRRSESNVYKLTNGPGKVCQALGVIKEMDGMNIFDKDPTVTIELPIYPVKMEHFICTKRIGISKNTSALLRFAIKS